MQSNTKPTDIFTMWKEISELKFELEGYCACCGGEHPVHECKGLCLRKKCVLKYMDISDKHYHQFKNCISSENKVFSRCNKCGYARPITSEILAYNQYKHRCYEQPLFIQEIQDHPMFTQDSSTDERSFAPLTLTQNNKIVFPSEPIIPK